ncbi:recombinase-like helix-turn-helix domain-containing protein [Roseomonas chloroacetimidivorans]|uniref:recombinase-like helix-turn-helix domain-containing protein n=1 Tax=Roseomonas chloroacetimidivorans TaxID=1766656 RepID=UPI003C76CEAC
MNNTYQFPYLEARQTLSRPMTDWESDLADTIEAAFAKGHWELEDLVGALNRSRVRLPTGGPWTPENFKALIHELGA